MLYYLFQLLQDCDLPGARLMTYITFRSGVAFILALLLATIAGRRIIDRLQLMQVGEIIRDLGLEGQMKKTGTPTMGGVIIIMATLIPVLLVGNLTSVYMLLMIFATAWLGALGFADDYLKLSRHNKDGMKGKFKIIGQVGLGIVVGLTMWLSPDIVMRENVSASHPSKPDTEVSVVSADQVVEQAAYAPAMKTPQTTIPFVKNNNFDYTWLTSWLGDYATIGGWVLFIIVTICAISATSNGANLTDGLDGLCAGVSTIIVLALAIMAYLGSSMVYAHYLNIMYIPGSEELVVFMAAFSGALIGFMWYNTYPAQVFMGDTGSLTIGGIIAVMAILIRKELLIPLLCAIFFLEDISVMIQVAYFKYTKRKTGTGRRVFKMTPLHHHFQKQGNSGIDAIIQKPLQAIAEPKIVARFWIIGILLAGLTFATLKIR
ncbi:MAG: phospho-N-acetylmuramoyl-pentapeptide-transferase [Pseudoflavonifractor sp.]|nr:phospho-N-acetylmuramoyl-pentapeptide-transferase [Alloprevotella sp.]MCM1117424.1 phospho-N-acetylmuramoyl-pentapeptide-transferase [Pseudoflavonifractor sp.]